MKREANSSSTLSSAGAPVHSFLVRVWVEPREAAGAEARVRLYVRDLRSGEERYLRDPDRIADLLRHQTGAWAAEAGEAERAGVRAAGSS